ncbi:CBS domain-containing protein [Candidatus Micrarchaeota archaeon]|nr:CBS domain-containing protein [Candidatus Micrarchaeota archaeon]
MKIRQTLVLDCNEVLSKATAKLNDHETVILVKDGKYYGTLDSQSVAFHGVRDATKVKCDSIALKPPVIAESASLVQHVDAFLLGNYHFLPVVSNTDAPVGVIGRADVLTEIVNEGVLPAKSLMELVSSPVWSISEKEKVSKAKAIMKEKNTHKLLVTNDKGYPRGLLWASDFATASMNRSSGGKMDRSAEIADIDQLNVEQVTRMGIHSVLDTVSLEQAADKMIKSNASELIIVSSSNKPVGILSALDIFKSLSADKPAKLSINISGLGKENMGYHQFIIDTVEHAVSRFAATLNVKNVQVHVKEDKSVFEVSLHLETNEGKISLHEEAPELKEAVAAACAELATLLRKKKDSRKEKPRVRKGGIEA